METHNLDEQLKKLTSNIKLYLPSADTQSVLGAWEFARKVHDGQLRMSGDPFFVHPANVAFTLADWKLDPTSIVAGLLHDTIEDASVTKSTIADKFGEDVANIVDGVSNVTGIRLTGNEQDRYVENLRKMFLVMAKDLRVIFVKLADRLHNMRTLSFLPPESRLANSRETLEIYAPLAERLGMGHVKGLLEDLAFSYVMPHEYHETLKLRESLLPVKETYLVEFVNTLKLILESHGLKSDVHFRYKHIYSLYNKLKRPGIDGDISKVHDLIAIRILVDDVDDCYLVLGAIHSKFHVVPFLNVSDFIANPKPNGYRSIHTKIFGPKGKIIEVQIRTREMHNEAEMGAAGHWYYSILKSSNSKTEAVDKGNYKIEGSKLSWVKQLMAWQKEVVDSQEYLNSLKFDALTHRNLVFTPKGDVLDLPAGSTPVDFAFAVHSDLGFRIVGATVNEKQVPIDFKLKNGDVVKIFTGPVRKTLPRDWLAFVVTEKARSSIRKSNQF